MQMERVMAQLDDFRVCLKKGDTEIWFTLKCEDKESVLGCPECAPLMECGFELEAVIKVDPEEDNG